ncbi:MAG TPA: PA14 domain-containing protein, partial [Chloroflexia bacterium]|nr:PA14 domain-containing protein [Chloroflexia bacterium]
TMIAVAMPYLIYNAETNFIFITSRAQETSIFTPSNQAVTFQRFNLPYNPALAEGSTLQSLTQHPAEWAKLVYEQARETLDVLYRRADQVFFYLITDHGGSMFPAFWATIVMLGIAYATWKLWDSRFALVLIWFWFGLLGSVLTVDTPNLQRVTGAWPALMLLPAALLDRIFAAGWPLSMSMARRWATIPLAAAVLFFGYTSVQEYFGHYAATCPYCDSTIQARYAVDLGQDYKAYQLGVGGYPYYFGHGSTRFLAKDVEGEDLLAAADHLPVVDSNGKGLAFIIYSNNFDYLPLLRLYYPGGTEESISSADGYERFKSYKVTREQLATFQVATATYRYSTGDPVTRQEPGLGTQRAQLVVTTQIGGQQSVRPTAMEPWTPPPGVTYPLQAIWEGGLVAPYYGSYSFATNGSATGVRLFVDGVEVIGGDSSEPGAIVELVLAKGVHEVILSGKLADANTSLGLLWSGTGAENRPVEARFLYKGPRGGLTAEIGHLVLPEAEALKLPDPFNGQEVRQRRVDPFIGFRETFDLFGSSPYLARWYGTLKADTDGVYSFATSSPQHTVLLIDEGIVIDGVNGLGSGSVQLSAGLHKIEMRYASPGGGARVELYWNTPGGEAGFLPPTALVPAKRAWSKSELLVTPRAQAQAAQEPSPPPTTMRAPRAVMGVGAGLKEPRGLAVDSVGNVYVGDSGNRRVVVFAPGGKVASTWGKPLPETYKPEQGEAPDGTFGEIYDLAVGVGADGRTYVYVLDSTTRVQVFATDGEQVGTYPAKHLDMYGPNGLATGPVGGEAGHKLYVSVTGQNRLSVYPSIDRLESLEPRSTLGELVRNIGLQGGVALEQPVDVLADPTQPDVVYVIDLHDRLLRIELQPDSESPTDNPNVLPSVASRQWQLVVGRDAGGSRLAVSPDGRHVYMSDPERNRVAVVNVENGILSYFGSIGKGEGEFLSPSGMAVGPDGLVYVLERLNNRVQVFDGDK